MRADRAFANEEAAADVVIDRAADVERLRAAWIDLLTETPYAPGDAWLAALAMAGERAEGAKSEARGSNPYRDGEHEIPVGTLLRIHLDRVKAAAHAPREEDAPYPSVLAALASLVPEGAPGSDVEAAFAAYEAAVGARAATAAGSVAAGSADAGAAAADAGAADAGATDAGAADAGAADAGATTEVDVAAAEARLRGAIDALGAADLTEPMNDRIARDALAVLSVALRATLESQALSSVLVKQSTQVVESAQRDLFSSGDAGSPELRAVAAVPSKVALFDARAARDRAWLERANAILGARLQIAQRDTAGFAYGESLVDQVASVQWDSLRGHARLDGELLFYSQLGAGGTSGDYTGRTRRLAYDLAPIALVGGRVDFSFDWLHVKNAATLGGAISSDRLFGTGGDVETSGSLGERLGLSGAASDVFDLGAGLLGVRTRFRRASLTSGELTEIAVDPATGADRAVVGKAPLRLVYTQLDVAYDVAFLLPPETVARYWIEEAVVGFRYMSYRLPRIVYELRDVSAPGSDEQSFRFDRESVTQNVTTRSYMGGGTFRFGQGETKRVSLFGDVGGYGGAGPVAYRFADATPRDLTALVFNGSLGLGGRLRLTSPRSRFRVLVEAKYHGEVIYQTVVTELRATTAQDGGTTYQVGKKVDFGAFDLFHGPQVWIVGVF